MNPLQLGAVSQRKKQLLYREGYKFEKHAHHPRGHKQVFFLKKIQCTQTVPRRPRTGPHDPWWLYAPSAQRVVFSVANSHPRLPLKESPGRMEGRGAEEITLGFLPSFPETYLS